MRDIFTTFDFWAIVDILIISYIIYHILLLIRGTRAAQMLTGLLIIAVAFILSTVVPLTTLNWVMNKFYSSFIIILIIIFQDDIRHVLRRMGKKSFIPGTESSSSGQVIDEITRAANFLSSKHIGALLVLERNIILSRYVDIGIQLDARVSQELLVAIFQHSSPIHDGAVIIQRGRITAAGCFLPLSREERLDPNMGTRHRAALGISQETDAIVVIISEERGTIALAMEGKISKKMESKTLRRTLRTLLIEEPEENGEDEESETLIQDRSLTGLINTALQYLHIGGKK